MCLAQNSWQLNEFCNLEEWWWWLLFDGDKLLLLFSTILFIEFEDKFLLLNEWFDVLENIVKWEFNLKFKDKN